MLLRCHCTSAMLVRYWCDTELLLRRARTGTVQVMHWYCTGAITVRDCEGGDDGGDDGGEDGGGSNGGDCSDGDGDGGGHRRTAATPAVATPPAATPAAATTVAAMRQQGDDAGNGCDGGGGHLSTELVGGAARATRRAPKTPLERSGTPPRAENRLLHTHTTCLAV